MMKVEGLGVRFGELKVLEDVSMTIGEQEFIALIGENGTGKTTLMRCLLGLLEPTEGHINSEDDLEIAYVPQVANFDKEFPITVHQVILSGGLRKKMKLFYQYSREDKQQAKRVMNDLGIEELAKRNLSTLSGGQLQKVLIARGLLSRPKILMLDEPTASVDDKMTEEIFALLKKISKERTVVIISHDDQRIKRYVDKIYTIKKGSLIEIE